MPNTTYSSNVIVVGAGAAGLMCAIEAGNRGRSVIVLERAEAIGKKIRISGGGRCNFTNMLVDAGAFLSGNPHFCKSALARYTPTDFIGLVERHSIPYHEKTLGQLFCDNSAGDIIAMLEAECRAAHVDIRLQCDITSVAYRTPDDEPDAAQEEDAEDPTATHRFQIETSLGIFTSESLVIASGGISIPKIGATDFGYTLAKSFDMELTDIRPGLVPLTWNKEYREMFGELSGVSLPASVRCGRTSFAESILFTHRGLSGPAILQISSYWHPGEEIVIDLLPEMDIETIIMEDRERNVVLATVLSDVLPKRFAHRWSDIYFTDRPLSQCSDSALREIADLLHHWTIIPAGTEGYEKAEVTVGGIDTNELSSKTMESRRVPGLYWIGEVVDVTGHLGGYNFQWAWSSGFVAGQYA